MAKKRIKVSRSKRGVLVDKVVTSKKKTSMSSLKSDGLEICSFCGLHFFVTRKTALFIKNLGQEVVGKWAAHEIIGRKAKSEFLGAELRSFTFEFTVDAQFGYKPHTVLKKVHQIIEKGKVDTFFLGTHKIGSKWKMTKESETYDVVYSGGKLAKATISATMEEY